MKKKINTVEEAKPILQEDHSKNSPQDADRRAFIPVAGGIITFCTVGSLIFTIFLMLKVEHVIHWDYWMVFCPVLVILFVLLVLTQSRTLSTRFPLVSRLAWLISVMCFMAFIVLLIMKLEKFDLLYDHIFIPIWILFGMAFVLGTIAIVVAMCFSDTDKRKSKYLTAGVPLLLGLVVFLPFALLASFKIGQLEHVEMNWSYVFIPLFIADGFFICISAFLLLFTIGARDSALFTIGQIMCFLFALPAAIVFKVLLVMMLDGENLSFYYVCIPLYVVQAMFITCGLNMIFNKHHHTSKDMSKIQTKG